MEASFPFLGKFEQKPALVRLGAARRESQSHVDAQEAESGLFLTGRRPPSRLFRASGLRRFRPDADLKLLNESIDIKGDLYKAGENRKELAKLVTTPEIVILRKISSTGFEPTDGAGIYEPWTITEYQAVSHDTLEFIENSLRWDMTSKK